MKVLVINGPNLNMLGHRDKLQYGVLTLRDIKQLMKQSATGMHLSFFQSNCEGKIVSKIQKSLKYDAIIINPGAYTHTSIAIHDALEMFSGPILEVHLSLVDEREEFRKINYIRPLATEVFAGNKENSYLEAINYLKKI